MSNVKESGSVQRKLRIVVAGPGAVGKSSLTIQFVMNSFVDYYDPTIEDSYRKQVVIDDQAYLLDILDTAGQEEYVVLQDEWFRNGHCFVLIYNITSQKSFQEVTKFHQRILAAQDKDKVPMILVGNMMDREKDREVSSAEGKELAKSMGCAFIETSAKMGINVKESFSTSIREYIRYEKEHKIIDPKSKLHRKKHCLIL